MVKIAEDIGELFPKRETGYLVARNDLDDGPTYYEVCNRGALISRLVKHFKGGPVRLIQVIRINEEPPYFEEFDKSRLKEMYERHKTSLET